MTRQEAVKEARRLLDTDPEEWDAREMFLMCLCGWDEVDAGGGNVTCWPEEEDIVEVLLALSTTGGRMNSKEARKQADHILDKEPDEWMDGERKLMEDAGWWREVTENWPSRDCVARVIMEKHANEKLEASVHVPASIRARLILAEKFVHGVREHRTDLPFQRGSEKVNAWSVWCWVFGFLRRELPAPQRRGA